MTALNHTAPYVPVTHRESECPGCHAALVVPQNATEVVYCRRCQHAQQDSDAGSIASQVRDLAAGAGPMFDLLTDDDKRVHLSQIALAVAYARVKLAQSDTETAAILAGPVSASQAVAYEHYVGLAADEPSEAEKQAIYEAEENIAREDAVANDWR